MSGSAQPLSMPGEISPKCRSKFPNYAAPDDTENWVFFGGRPRGRGGGAKDGGLINAFERTCSGINSACWRNL